MKSNEILTACFITFYKPFPFIFSFSTITMQLLLSKITKALTLTILILGSAISAQAQIEPGATCEQSVPFCIYEGNEYSASTNAAAAPFGNNYGCLGTQPNPGWFYLEMDVAGALSIQLSNSNNVDIDFALWGPYPNLTAAIDDCGSLPFPVSCSYNPAANETVQIPGLAQVGDIFILLVTNFSNQPTVISAEATGGNGNTSCDNICIAGGGVLNSPDLMVCEDNPVLSLPPTNATDNPDYQYTYIIADANTGTIVDIDPTPNMNTVGPGNYTVCGFSVSSDDAPMLNGFQGQPLSTMQGQFAGNMDPFCGDFSDDCVNVMVGMALMPITINETLCQGECIILEGIEVCNSTTLSVPQGDGCDQVYNITIANFPPNIQDIEVIKCPNECANFQGVDYCQAGSYTINYVDSDGCDATIFLDVIDVITVAAIIPNPPPPLDCNNPSILLTAATSTPSGGPYEWNGPNGFFSTDENIIVMDEGDYTLTVFNNSVTPACIDMITVTVSTDAGSPDLQTDDPIICMGESVDLQDHAFDLNGNSTITFHSNTPTNGGNQISSTVSPSVTTTYYILATDGSCTDEDEITVFVNDTPTADFVVDSPICLTDESTITYIGTSGFGATYNWNFSAGSASPGNGQGPHTVSFPAAGLYTITLTVEENGCTSTVESMEIEVIAPVDTPVIQCLITSPTSVEFFWSAVNGANGYDIQVITGQSGMMTGATTFLVDDLASNEAVTIIVTVIGDVICGDVESAPFTCTSDPCPDVIIDITPVDQICLDGMTSPFNLQVFVSGDSGNGSGTWSGSAIIDAVAGTVDPSSLVVGDNIFTYDYLDGDCPYSEMITIVGTAIPTADFSATSPLCVTSFSTVTYEGSATANANYIWNFDGGMASPGNGQGPHTVTWSSGGLKIITLTVEETGCFSEPFDVTIDVLEQLPAPVINCDATTNSIEFTWAVIPDADSYNVTVNSGQTGTMTDPTTFLVDGLMPGDVVSITVEAIGNAPCAPSSQELTCLAENCEPIVVNIDAVADICLDGIQAIVNLVATSDDATPTGIFEFGGSPAVTIDGMFDPSLANVGPNTVTVTYIEGNCTYNGGTTINVFEQPTADFTVDSPICESDFSLINYSGNASSNATYTWDFDDGNAAPGTGPGPHQVNWNTPGTYTVTLMVEENGCTSAMSSQTMQVDATLATPDIDCTSTLNSVEFTWDSIAGATGYTVNILSGQMGSLTSDTSFIFTGLSMMETVTIELTVETNSTCGNITLPSTSCETTNCPSGTIDIVNPSPVCLTNNSGPITLEFTVTGITTDTVCWSGSCIPNPKEPIFDPTIGQPGPNEVTVTIINGSCTYTETIVIDIFEQPTADFMVSGPICIDATSTVTYTGNAPAGSIFTWDFGSGTAMPGTGAGPHEVSWGTTGLQNITLIVTDNNSCASEINTQTVQVNEVLTAPDIGCTATLNSVEFSWDSVAGATGYTVNVLSGQMGSSTSDTSFIFTGLTTMETVNIELVVETNSACGSITIPATCETTDCPQGDIFIVNPGPICLDGNSGPITLEFIVTGISMDTVCWSGSCIPNPKEPIFDPTMGQIGLNDVTVTIINGECTYTESIVIEVIAPPTADFTASSPICIDATSTIMYTGNAPAGSIFTWDFGGGTAMPGTGAGPYEVSWGTTGPQTIALMVTDVNDCASDISMVDVQVDDLLVAPLVNCSSTTTSVEFFWNPVPGATDYIIDVLTGETGMMTSDTSYEITNLPIGTTVEITVTANGNTVCGSSMTTADCTALDCPTVIIDITPVDDICLEGFSVPLAMEVMVSGNPNCVGEWDGQGIIDPINGTFDPIVAGIGQHFITYTCTDGPCITTQTTTINIFAVPVIDFTFTTPICEDDASTIEFTGAVSANATYTWNFSGGTANPGGNSSGPHLVTWIGADTQTVTLVVQDNGCTSEIVAHDIVIESPLIAPLIDCTTTTESIEFIWNTVAGASGYNVTVLAGQTGTQTSDTTYLVTGLNPLDMVTISVEVVDNGACDNITVETTCTAVDCPDVTIDILPIGPYCFGNLLQQEILEVTVMGGNGGTGIWSGSGIINPNDNVFDPIVAGVGTHQLIYTYTEDNCSYNESIIVEIIAAPNADAGLAQTLTCVEPNNVAQLGGLGTSVGANITYDWNTATGIPFPSDSTITNPIVSVPGVYTLVVTNMALGCSASSTVSVDANQGIPIPNIVSSMASCFGEGNGSLFIDSVANGTPPYLYSFNGAPLSSTNFFPNLSAGEYNILVEDDNGCTFSATVDVEQPEELTMNLNTNIEGDNQIDLGDSVTITIQVNEPYIFEDLDSVQWIPALAVNCDTCVSNTVMPTVPTTYTIIIQDGDCVASDALTILVSKDLEIYVPNVFSPNGDGQNEFVFPQAKPGVVSIINSFLIFNRWGESVYQIYNLPPNDISLGWNGTQRGKPLNPQVFVWFAEVEFVDGTTKIFKGDVTLIK
jgi:gliding motility-associated-like protein